MNMRESGQPYCKSCGTDIDADEEVCPHCGFHPRNIGLRYAGFFMILVVILFSTVIVIGGTFPELAGYILLGMYGAFLLAVVAIVIAFMVTPYRLGGLFA